MRDQDLSKYYIEFIEDLYEHYKQTSENIDLIEKYRNSDEILGTIKEIISSAFTQENGVLLEQVGGTHYKGFTIDPVKIAMDNNLDFCQGNAIKYIMRYDKKGTPLQDLEKAKHYIDLLIFYKNLKKENDA